MKKIIALAPLIFLSIVIDAQTDSVKKQIPVTKTDMPGNIKVKPASVRIKEIESIFKQMEIKLEELNALSNKLKENKESIGELNQQDMLMLQQLMEKKNQLESMISNVMKAGFEGGQAAIRALKGS
ncbi:MAG TPA: hypothetical protein VN451_10220 [Chitinophagaceae bacterium]|nr:hypothetical protein [Chitinophagaceae bacterium]